MQKQSDLFGNQSTLIAPLDIDEDGRNDAIC